MLQYIDIQLRRLGIRYMKPPLPVSLIDPLDERGERLVHKGLPRWLRPTSDAHSPANLPAALGRFGSERSEGQYAYGEPHPDRPPLHGIPRHTMGPGLRSSSERPYLPHDGGME